MYHNTMFHFILTLILINSYSVTWGAPTNTDNMISNWLSNLATSCENQFLSTQIHNKTQACQVSVPPYHEKQFECLIFYDINKQLCEAIGSSKLALNEDYSVKIQEHQDVTQLCNAAKDWTFSDNGEVYNRLVRAVFHDSIRCSKVCTVDFDDILNVDANYVCKYMKWGNEMLKSHMTPESSVVISAPQAQVSGIVNTDKAVELVTQNKIPDPKTETNNVVAPAKQNDVTDNKVSSDVAVSTKTASSDTSDIEVTNKEATHAKQSEQVAVSDSIKKDEPQPVLLPANTASSTKEQPNEPISKDEDNKDKPTSEINKTEVEDKKPAVSDPRKDGDLLNQVENPKPKEIEDDIDPDESDDGLLDTQGDEDDPSLTDLEPKIDQDLDKKPVKSNEIPIYNNDISAKDMYPNTIPDGFSEDDDHFFPFFLTAVIMVILIYVLYHNKSKVSKVFLGLIVEGRQSNRRRNSRGHAYRRLDTLEQAMSANSAAPPSKIIY